MPWILLASLAAASAAIASTPPRICPVEQPAAFACQAGAKVIAVCGRGADATYRYGAPGKIEMEAGAPAFNFNGDSGGGESQITFRKGDYTYVVYDWAFRTRFGTDGRNDEAFIQGVLARRGGVTLADIHCTRDPPDATRDLYHTGESAPPGPHVEHTLWCPARGVVRHGKVVALVYPKSCT